MIINLGGPRNTCTTPPLMAATPGASVTHLTAPVPRAAMPNPISPPIRVCVDETGMPTLVARVRHSDEAMTAHTIPSISSGALSANCAVSTMPLRMVLVTPAPAMTAPLNSMTAARHMAPR